MLNNLYFAIASKLPFLASTAANFSSLTGTSVMSKVLGVIAALARYFGIGIVAVGAWQFVHAMQESDGQGKSKAILLLVAGVAAFAMGAILKAIFGGSANVATVSGI